MLRFLWSRRPATVPVKRPRRPARTRAFELSRNLELEPRVLLTIAVQFDYSRDTANFFNTQAKRDLLQAAANAITAPLGDSLSAIQPSGTNTWSEAFLDPATGTNRTVSNPTVPANTIVIYVGARTLSGPEAGLGGFGGYSVSGDQNWLDTVQGRGQAGALATPATDFGPWGGSIAFDNSGGTNWYFGLDASGLQSNQLDFLSVAEHEIGHVLGIGTAPSWTTDVSGNTFIGPAAKAANGGQPVPLDASASHWALGTTSGGQVAVMTPVLNDGERRAFTPLDFAGLSDIGWQVASTVSTVQFSQPTYSVSESAGILTIPVTRSGPATSAVSLVVQTSDGTAKAGIDYLALTQTLTWSIGDTSTKNAVITLLNPEDVNTSKSFTVTLKTITGSTAGTPSVASLTIQAPPAVVQFAGSVVSANSTDGTSHVVLSRSGNLAGTVSVILATPGGSGIPPFQVMVTFPPNVTTISVVIPISNDGVAGRADAAIPITLSAPSSGAILGSSVSAALVIHDNNPLPPPLTVTSLQLPVIKVGKGKHAKRETAIELFFTGPLDPAAAQRLASYQLLSDKPKKKGVAVFNKRVALASATYDPIAQSVTLITTAKLNLALTEQLRISATALVDEFGRSIDGNFDGQPGGDFLATFSRKGIAIVR